MINNKKVSVEKLQVDSNTNNSSTENNLKEHSQRLSCF